MASNEIHETHQKQKTNRTEKIAKYKDTHLRPMWLDIYLNIVLHLNLIRLWHQRI